MAIFKTGDAAQGTVVPNPKEDKKPEEKNDKPSS